MFIIEVELKIVLIYKLLVCKCVNTFKSCSFKLIFSSVQDQSQFSKTHHLTNQFF